MCDLFHIVYAIYETQIKIARYIASFNALLPVLAGTETEQAAR